MVLAATAPEPQPAPPGLRAVRADRGPPEEGVWFDDRNDVEWGFACWLVPAGVTDRNAQAIATLTVLIDRMLLARPADDGEAFHWELHGGPHQPTPSAPTPGQSGLTASDRRH